MNGIKYKAAAYCRLSHDDGSDRESNSISNQKLIIRNFVKQHPDIEIIDEKIDDGFTGINLNRPSLEEMLEDIKKGRVNCVIVKDLSRFSRNYLEAGNYIEHIFPTLQVRFISISENYDSLNKNTNDNLFIALRNLFNDYYSSDISTKTKTSIEAKTKRGEYISPFAVYGYKKDENNKNKIKIDTYAAQIVKRIFKERLNGMSNKTIADMLNHEGILSPSEYKKNKGLNYKTCFKQNTYSKWTESTINRILQNPVYIGTLVQLKTMAINHKLKKRKNRSKEEQSVIENNHEPIISKEIFEAVNKIMKSDTRTPPGKNGVYLFSGKLFCSDCGENLIRRKSIRNEKEYVYYTCYTNKKDKSKCTSHRINEDNLIDCVVISIRNKIQNIIDIENILEIIKDIPTEQSEITSVDKQICIKKEELNNYINYKNKLYESYLKGIVKENDYKEHNQYYEERIKETETVINNLKDKIENIMSDRDRKYSWIEEFKKYKNIKKLNRNIVVIFIDKIIVHENNKVEIIFNYSDEYEDIFNYINNVYKVINLKNENLEGD